MRKFYDLIGFVDQVQTAPGVWEDQAVERFYYGDILRNTRKYETGASVNGTLNVNNQISIVADAYAFENFFKMRYIHWMDTLWVVTNVEVQRPRLILTLGGVYHGVENRSPANPGDDAGV